MEQHSANSITSGHSNAATMNIPRKPGNLAWGIPPGFNVYSGSNDASLFSTSNDANLFSTSHDASLFSSSNAASLFSSSLPILPRKEYSESGLCFSDDASSKLDNLGKDVEDKDPIEDLDLQGIGVLLPDEDELLDGIMDDYDLSGLPSQLEELEECDLFGSGGGMELDFDPTEGLTIGMARANISDAYLNSSIAHYSIPNGSGTVAGEHPFGEHPSRTLFVRNINSNVEDLELRSLFEQYGDIRTLYTACKHRGFVMVSYYDIRAARTAMHALQNKPLRRRKLDIHFSIPKDNPSEKDINQGTLVVFNLEPSVSNDDLRQIFGSYGEVKEIRETPHKQHHKFIEYYDVRAAEAALRALNRSDIAGKRIKLEPSRPGGARRNLMRHMSQDPELDDIRSYRQKVGSPIINSPPGNWAHVGSPTDSGSFHTFNRSPNVQAVSPVAASHLPGLASILPPRMSNSVKIAPIGKDHCRINHGNRSFTSNSLTNGVLFPHSFPDNRTCTTVNMSSSAGTSFGPTTSSRSGIGTLSGSQFLWGNPSPYPEHTHSSAWPASPMGHSLLPSGQGQGLSYANRHGSFLPPALHHVGSAPSGIHFEKHFGYFPESPEASFLRPSGKMAPIGRNEGSLLMSMSPRSPSLGNSLSGNISENGSPGFRMISPRSGNMFPGDYPYSGPTCSGFEGLISHGNRFDNNMGQFDSKKYYQLDLEKIVSGKDTRTTLMIKNIPNKYTSKMLLAAIDEKHKSTYDFVYLPIDFKNKCNVGYAFINMMSPSHIISFYEAFNGKKWEKFNSEKVASLAYARIQGLEALKAHFQNSSLMNEDKRCRPIIFHAEGPEAVDQEPFPLNGTIFCPRHQD